MRFLSVADRELRSAARQKATYRARWITAALFLGLLVWLLWVFQGFSNRRAGPDVFRVLSVLTFLYCLFIAATRTADCISAERREGTLGFLFLTNLNSAEIIAGKLCSTALAAVYGLMAIFPMLALPLLIGGISFAQFAQTVVGLLNGILFALAAGFLASVVCKRQFVAIALALGVTISVAGGVMIGAAAANAYAPTRPLAVWVAPFSPLYAVLAADGARFLGPNRFWHSVLTVAGISLLSLTTSVLLLARTWRDRPEGAHFWHSLRFWSRSERYASARYARLRRRLLAINPLFWLAGRGPVSSPVFMFLAVLLTMITVYVAAPLFGRVMSAGVASPVLGHLFAWLWTGLAIHVLVLYYAAMCASQRLAEDKQTGALELILCTPTTERTISRGLWLAYARKMFFPAALAVLVHVFFIWLCLVMASLDPPGRIPAGAAPGEIFWCALLDRPYRGQMLSWEFGFLLRCALLILLQLVLTWPTLGWVGRWLGLRMKHPGFAPITSLALLIAPPILLFSLACYLALKFNLDRLSERRFLPLMMWLGLTIGVAHCLVLSVWAAKRLRNEFRSIAMSRYQPLPVWRFRPPGRRSIRRFATAAAASAAVVTSLVVSYYGYQNWHSKHSWKTFLASLRQRQEALELSPLLPQPAREDANFATSAAFTGFVSRPNTEATDLFEAMRSFSPPINVYPGKSVLMDWTQQSPSPLHPFLGWTAQNSSSIYGTKREEDAAALVQFLQSHSGRLREIAAAADRLQAFQITTNRDAGAVLQPVREEVLMLERLHLLFEVRACALLALGRNAEAAEDVMTGFRLTQLARQLPDTRSSLRVQVMLGRSLQPLWEGLSQHAWAEPQLSAFQHELARFNLLADYTNAVRRVVLAHIEFWSGIPDGAKRAIPLSVSDTGYANDPASQLQPRAWWFDNCIQLHQAGRNVLEQVNVGGERIEPVNWNDLNGLPLDSASRELLQQSLWRGANPAVVAFAQTTLKQAIIACALERFRLARNTLPQTLQELVPGFLDSLPRDAVSGRPIIYEQVAEGCFVLRGVGPNGTDDRSSKASDDWLWTYSSYTSGTNSTKPLITR